MARLVKHTIWQMVMTTVVVVCLTSPAFGASLTVNAGTVTLNNGAGLAPEGVTVNSGGALTLGAKTILRISPTLTLAINQGGTLTVSGTAGNLATITRKGASGTYAFNVGGTINAQYCNFNYIDATGLNIGATATVSSLDNCIFDDAGAATASYITVAGAAITANKAILSVTFDATTLDSNASYNVTLTGSSSYYWLFQSATGNKAGEAYDNDNGNPGTIRWDDSDMTPPSITLITLPFDNLKTADATPLFTFTGTDPESAAVDYEIRWDTDYNFGLPTTKASANYLTDAGWTAGTFTSGASLTYTIQAANILTNGATYWWQVRARDPAGSNTWSTWTTARSFTIDTTVTVPTWHQTTKEQFDTDTAAGTVAPQAATDDVRMTGP